MGEATSPQPSRRYRVEAELGRGGMATVSRAVDTVSGRTLALKRLKLDVLPPARHEALTALFQREYCTLAQLSHPNIIRVYEYGVDEDGPFYTMELLDGEDLSAQAPLDWRRACAFLRDVASSLAILHARKLLHRDVSPRNVRCTPEGRAKLLDFGAMAPMGVCRQITGTPACVAPEALRLLPLDGRSDLYSLGAVAYWALTRRFPRPVTHIAQLEIFRGHTPRAPSAICAEIPPALDRLVLSLVAPEPQARPSTAAEVIERLEAIAGLAPLPSGEVARAYLVTPNLVGREWVLDACRARLERARCGRGAVLSLEGEPGSGRTRLLHALALEGELAGATVLRAGAGDTAMGEYGLVRAWVDDLLRLQPGVARRRAQMRLADLADLVEILPALREQAVEPSKAEAGDPPALSPELRARLPGAVADWLCSVAGEVPLLLLADDAHLADRGSVAVLAAMARASLRAPLLIVQTLVRGNEGAGATTRALQLVREGATCISLDPLSGDATLELLRSIFGEAERIEILARWMQERVHGNPGLCIELAQYLVEHGDARHEGGWWILPEDPRRLGLSGGLESLLDLRLAELDDDARTLVAGCALLPRGSLPVAQLPKLLAGAEAERRAYAALDALIARQLVVEVGEGRVLAQPGAGSLLAQGLDEAERRRLSLALAEIQTGAGASPFAIAHHLFEAGERDRALEHAVRGSRQAIAGESGAARLPLESLTALLEGALERCRERARPRRDEIALLRTLLLLAAANDPSLGRHAPALLAHLRRDAGIDVWEALPEALDASERTRRALARVQASYESTPEHERGLPAGEAVHALATCVGQMMSVAARSREPRRTAALAPLLEPFRAISPAAALFYDVVRSVARRSCHREETANFRALIERLQGDVPGVSPDFRLGTARTMRFYLALSEATEDSERALAAADWIGEQAFYAALAWQVRKIAHIYRGDAVQAGFCERERELAVSSESGPAAHAKQGLFFDCEAYARCGDLMQLKRLLPQIQREAERYPGWTAVLELARGEYHALRGELEEARRCLERSIGLDGPGEGPGWAQATARCIDVMIRQGEGEAALRRALEAREQARVHDLFTNARADLDVVLALAEAATGEVAPAAERIEAQLARLPRGVGTPLMKGWLLEARLRVALQANDPGAFSRTLKQLGEQYRPGQYPTLLARYQQLVVEGCERFPELDSTCAGIARLEPSRLVDRQLGACDGPRQRAQRALRLLLGESARGVSGYLFGPRADGLACLSHEEAAVANDIRSLVLEYLDVELDDGEDTTLSVPHAEVRGAPHWLLGDGKLYRPVPLACYWKGDLVLASVAVLEDGPDAPPVTWELSTEIARHLIELGDVDPRAYAGE